MSSLTAILLGLILLAAGGEALVRGTVGLARRLGLSELLIGLTLVGFGTSAPELITSIDAALQDAPGISLGNVIGSNISNVLFVFALVAMLRPFTISPIAVRHSGALVVAVSMILAGMAILLDQLDRLAGAALLLLLAAYIVLIWRAERPRGAVATLHKQVAKTHDPAPQALWLTSTLALGGLVALIVGADLMVGGAIKVAGELGLSETVIGITIVAVGTSLPEMIATLVAALRSKSDVAFGGIIGSNIYNILGILGVTALVHPIDVPADIRLMDWLVLIGSAVLLTLFSLTGHKVTRTEGAILFSTYLAYTAYLVLR